MIKENSYEFELRIHLKDIKKEDERNLRKYPHSSIFNSGRVKSVLKNNTIGYVDSPLNSSEDYINKLTGERFFRAYQRVVGKVDSKNIVEVVRSILTCAKEAKVDFIKIEQFSPNDLENKIKSWEWNEGVLEFKDYSKNKRQIIPKEFGEYKLFDEAINKNSKQKNH